MRDVLLAAKDDLLEEEHMVLAVDLGLGDAEDVVEKERAEVRDVVTLPVLYAALEVLDSCVILCAPLSLIDLIGDAFSRVDASFEFIDPRVIGVVDGFKQRLSGRTCEHVKGLLSGRRWDYLEKERIFANPLHRLD